MRESTNDMSVPDLYTAEQAANELLEGWQELRCFARRGQYNRQAPPPVPQLLTEWREKMIRRLTVLRPILESARDAVTVARGGKPLVVGYRIEASAVTMVLKLTDQVLETLHDPSVVESASSIFCEQLEKVLELDLEELRVTSEADFAKARLQQSIGQLVPRMVELPPAAHVEPSVPGLQLSTGPATREQTAVADRSSRVRPRPRFNDWAFGIEHAGAWQLFKRFGSEFRHQGKAKGIAKGRQEDLLACFAKGGGYLSDDEAVKLIRRTFSDYDRKQIMKIIKPAISKLREVIRDNLNIAEKSAKPLERTKQPRGWQAIVQIGYAVKNDQDRLEFKLAEQLSREENLDT